MADGSMKEWTVERFLDAVASDAPVPGGGAVAAFAGAAGSALVHMVIALAARRAKDGADQPALASLSDRARALRERFANLADEDVAAYGEVAEVLSLPRSTDGERAARRAKLQEALTRAAAVPLETAQAAVEALRLAAEAAPLTPRAAQSDLLTAVQLAYTACCSALVNVDANALALEDTPFRKELARAHGETLAAARELHRALLDPLQASLGKWRPPGTPLAPA